MTLTERAAYIKGLAEGMELDTASKEGKVIAALIELCSDMAEEIAALDDRVDTVHAYCEELDEDLGSVEEILLEDEDYDDEFESDGDCCNCDEECELADEDYFEVECPACGDTICFDGSIDPEELVCPACGEKFECLISEEDLKALDAE